MTTQQAVQTVITAVVWVTLSGATAFVVMRNLRETPAARVQGYIDCLGKCGSARFPEGMDKPPCGEVCSSRR